MVEEIRKLIEEVESKVDLDFDFEAEHWECGNFDDSFSYGILAGEQYAYRDILVKLKKLK